MQTSFFPLILHSTIFRISTKTTQKKANTGPDTSRPMYWPTRPLITKDGSSAILGPVCHVLEWHLIMIMGTIVVLSVQTNLF